MSALSIASAQDRQRELTHSARLANEARGWERMYKREDAAEALVGELCRDGETIYYINLRNGKTKEGFKSELIAFLVRNDYV